MNKITVNFFLFLLLTASVHAFEPSSGIVLSFSKTSNWETDEHKIEVGALFHNEDFRNFTIKANVNHMLDFQVNDGDRLTILNERPDVLVGNSLFTLSFEGDKNSYEADGNTWQLTMQDWDLDETMFMITKVTSSGVVLNGQKEISAIDLSENVLGKIFVFDKNCEKFIPENPGYSYFTYVSLNDSDTFKSIALSIDSHWTPSKEQLKNSVSVSWVGKATVGMSGHIMAFRLSNDQTFSLGNSNGHQIPNWLKVGDQWMKFHSYWYTMGRNGQVERGVLHKFRYGYYYTN